MFFYSCRFLSRRIVQDATTAGRVRSVLRSHRKSIARLQTERAEGTNVYHKAQYINAFVEAESARMMHERRAAENTANQNSLLTLINSSRPPTLVVTDNNNNNKGLHVVSSTAQAGGVVEFGSWRKGDAALERACLAMDRNLHCIVRGATTPPALSPEAIQRDVCMRRESVRRLLRYIRGNGDTRACMHAEWTARRVHDFSYRMDACLRSACGGDTDMRQRLMAMLLHSTAAWNWKLALQIFHEVLVPHIHKEQRLHEEKEEDGVIITTGKLAAAAAASATSTFIAVLCESIRCHYCREENTEDSGPSFNTVVGLTKSSSSPLLPVAAAPLFSILRPSDSATWKNVVDIAQRFQSHGGQRRMYLPSIAWGEMLRAMHRVGASLAEIQFIVDAITNPTQTKNADKHMQDTNIWNAYISVSDWQHALDVYSNNLPHYGVKETAATGAALMESLVRGREWEKALDVFRRVQKKEGQLIIGTCGLFTVLFRALEQKRDWHTLTSFLMNFEQFLVYFDVSHEYWMSLPLRNAVKMKTRSHYVSEEEFMEWVAFVREFRECSNATTGLVRAMEAALVACNPREKLHRQAKETEKNNEEESGMGLGFITDDIMTAESLHDIM